MIDQHLTKRLFRKLSHFNPVNTFQWGELNLVAAGKTNGAWFNEAVDQWEVANKW